MTDLLAELRVPGGVLFLVVVPEQEVQSVSAWADSVLGACHVVPVSWTGLGHLSAQVPWRLSRSDGLRFEAPTFRVLGVLWPRGTIWSGQVIFSPPRPSGGTFNKHLLLGGGLPRVHCARSPVPPQLLPFATPRSLRHLATVGAGAYQLVFPPAACWPGLPAPPGPCYWLVASGTPMDWLRGCLAVGLVRSTVCYYCLGGCSALVV